MSRLSLAYCTNYWMHHQSPICGELANLLGEDHFRLCLFDRPSEERRRLGYATEIPDFKWIVGPPNSAGDIESIVRTICDADVAVMGACSDEVKTARIATGKLTFIMSERVAPKGFFRLRMLNPRYARGTRRFRSLVNRPHVHYLAIGHHAATDARRVGVFGDRIWNWGYFVAPSEAIASPRSSESPTILWAGRFLRYKRVDMIVRAVARLGPVAANCTLELIGRGPTQDVVKRLARRLGLADRIRYLDSMTPRDVRDRMAKADIYVLPSNHLEGWGAVVGEAMSEGCAVVASKAAGASATLIDHGRTGFLFDEGNVRDLAEILGQLLEDAKLRRQVGQAAAAHMRQLWHPRVAAERLVVLCQGLLGTMPIPDYRNGPCSRTASV